MDDEMFEQAVVDLVHFLRRITPEDPLAQLSSGLDRSHQIILATIPDPFLAAQAAFEVVR